jgi:hypothetical protein
MTSFKGRVRSEVEILIANDDLRSVENYLVDIVRSGHKQAKENYQKINRGNTVGHIFAVLFSVVEIAVLSLVISAVQHGFQTIVTCGLGIIYSTLAFFAAARAHGSAAQHVAVLLETTRLRRLL